MGKSWIIILGCLVAINANLAVADKITTEKLVTENNYPFESHVVQTEDGYLLELHRIPYSPKNKACNQTERPIAFFMHGLACSSADWVVLGPERSLVYPLSDDCYDIWMGNSRGNTYSRRHITLNPNLPGKFWDFTWHEMGTKDLPAMIDYIRKETGKDEMQFIGHSQGTTTFFVMGSLNETYLNYIKSAHLITPLAFAEDLSKEFLNIANDVISILSPLPNLLASTEFRPNGTVTELAGAALCDDKPRELCSDVLFLLVGFDEMTVYPPIITDVLSITPAGASTKCYLQYFQVHDSNKFQQYDYGLLGNLRRYGSSTPPTYPIENIKVPVYLYWGNKDRLIHKPDVDRIAASLPNLKNMYLMENATFMSPMYSQVNKDNVYAEVIKDLKSMK